jgi:outer membrane protein, heavy metal efflux system
MSVRALLACCGLIFVSGCLYHAREHTDETVSEMVGHPYDVAPPESAASASPPAAPPKAPGASAEKRPDNQASTQADVQTTAYMAEEYAADQLPPEKPKIEPKVPPEIPGSEAPAFHLPEQQAARQRAIVALFPPLPPLPPDPTALPGPEGRPYTLAQLQQLAAANSPDLRQAASDVEAARGNLIQARAYPNPTLGWNITPSNDGSVPGAPGPFIDQLIKTGGKLKLASASAEMDLKNAQLALRRARSDLSTRVRSAYYALLVAKETVRVNRGLAVMTDQIYRLHADLAAAGSFAAPYEPMALRGQAYTARLAHKQSIETYIYAWKALVSVVNLRQLPLSQVEGHIDRVIPYYDYDKVLDRVLRNHTDVLTARNGIDKAKYQLKLQQIVPLPDIDVNFGVINDYVVPPKQFTPMATIGLPLFPVWDQNKGNIMAAEAAHIRAMEEPHRVEMNLTNLLATAYTSYKTNLDAVEYYRHHILPDQVRAYRGVLARRQVDPSVAFSDLFGAQQTLATSVSTYLGILGSLWSSVVSVADLLQTDDIFQLAEPRDLPRIPDLEHLPTWPCCHPGVALDNPVPPSLTVPPAPGALSMGIDGSAAAKNTVASFSPNNTSGTPAPNPTSTQYPDSIPAIAPRTQLAQP